MPIDPGPHDLKTVWPILTPGGGAVLKKTGPTFFQELGDDFESMASHQLISTFDFSEPWPTWEMHPLADEFIYLLSGDTDLLLKAPGQEAVTVRVDRPGTFVMVPKGSWHTARPRAPTSMLFVTAGEGTRNEVEPPE